MIMDACVSDRKSNVLDRISFKLRVIMDLPTGHMHVHWIFDPIQNGRLAAIFDVHPGLYVGMLGCVSDRTSNMLDRISFKLPMIIDLHIVHMHVNRIFDPIQNG